LKPDLNVKSVSDIDFEKLLKIGKRVFLFDFDNTIGVWKSQVISENILNIFEYLKSNGAQVFIITNGKRRDMHSKTDVRIIWRSLKPLTFKVKKNIGNHLKDKSKVVVIGDQISRIYYLANFSKHTQSKLNQSIQAKNSSQRNSYE